MRSKERQVLTTLFNNPKSWTYSQLVEETGISKPQLANHLKTLAQAKMIKKERQPGRHPTYTLENNETVKERKRRHAQEELEDLATTLAKSEADVAIIFGSMTRWDWYDDSDVDVFIYGDAPDLKAQEQKLGREIDLHHAKDKDDLRKMKHLLPHIIEGRFIKGNLEKLGATIDV